MAAPRSEPVRRWWELESGKVGNLSTHSLPPRLPILGARSTTGPRIPATVRYQEYRLFL
jgi:hypothetical protein